MNIQTQEKMNMGVETVQVNNTLPDVLSNNQNYKMQLRQRTDVQSLTNLIDVQDTNSIINFGQQPSQEISKISDELLRSMRSVNSEEAGQMLTQLTKLMDKFDIQEIENSGKEEGVFSKIFKFAQNNIDKLFAKYDNLGKEVDKIYQILKQYEIDIRKTNESLEKQYNANVHFFEELEKYVVAGELGIEEIDNYMNQVQGSNMEEQQKNMQIQKLSIIKEMLSQRVYDLQIAENVAMQTCPMIHTIQMSNFNLLRKINSSFIITLPIFKQCLVQAIQLKRQEIQARSIKQLDEKTNELLLRNARNTASQSVNIARMAGGSSIQMETLRTTYETIKSGIKETRKITEELAEQRKTNTIELENIKSEMKNKGLVTA